MFAGNSVEQVVPGPDFTAGVKNVTVPEGRLVFNIMIVMLIMTIIHENPKGCHTLVFGGEAGQSQGGVDSL